MTERSLNVRLFSDEDWVHFEEALKDICPSEEMFRRALSSACVKMAAWLRTRAVRELSEKLHLTPSVLRRRFLKFSLQGKVRAGKLWLGLRGVPFIDLKPKQEGKGVVTGIGDYYEEGAFITRARGRMVVWKRKGKTWAGKKNGKWVRGPVKTPSVKIDGEGFAWLKRAIERPEFSQHFTKLLEHEVQWRMTKLT